MNNKYNATQHLLLRSLWILMISTIKLFDCSTFDVSAIQIYGSSTAWMYDFIATRIVNRPWRFWLQAYFWSFGKLSFIYLKPSIIAQMRSFYLMSFSAPSHNPNGMALIVQPSICITWMIVCKQVDQRRHRKFLELHLLNAFSKGLWLGIFGFLRYAYDKYVTN